MRTTALWRTQRAAPLVTTSSSEGRKHMKKILVTLGAWLALTCAAMAQLPNGAGTPPSYKTLFCQNVGGNTTCTSSDGSNWGCSTAQPAVCTVPATLVNGEAWIESCTPGQGGAGGQSGAGTAGGGGGSAGACIIQWRVQLTASAQVNIQVGIPGTGGVVGSSPTGGSNTTNTMSGAGLLTPFPSFSIGTQATAGSAGTGGTGGTGNGTGAPGGGTAGNAGTGVGTGTAPLRGQQYIFGASGGGGGNTAGTAGTGGSAIAMNAGSAGAGNGAGGGGGSCYKGQGNTGGAGGSPGVAPAAGSWCAGGGGGGTNAAGGNGSPGYFILGAVY
jgi:hypothetical protein